MKQSLYLFSLLIAIGFGSSCKTTKQLVVDENGIPVPQITWEKQTQDLGTVKRGESRKLEYAFTNTGSADLHIELVTSCKCTSLDWPRQPIPPSGQGVIKVTYDSTGQKLGPLTKTIDVIADTDPIVVEAFFEVKVVD